jgi:hypothetical protein
MPAAWSDGQAHPWPTSAEARAQREKTSQMSPRAKERADAKAQARANAQAARPSWLGKSRAKVVDSTAIDVADSSDGAGPTPLTKTPSPSTSAAKRKKKRRH